MRKRKSNENAVDSNRLGGDGTKAEILNQQFKPGDLTWVEIHNSSWWPAQVFDEGSVGAKPRKKSKKELLVRLYGTYEYMYVDASKSNSEFEDVLKRENKTMKEMFQEALEQDMSLMLPKGQSKLESSKTEGIDSAEASKDKKQQCELTKEPSAVEADEIATAVKICTNKKKKEGSSKRKRKLDFSKDERENKEAEPKASKAEAPNIKKQKVAKHADFKKHESSIVKRSPCVASAEKTSSTNSEAKAPISENQEEMKAKDLEIRKIVTDIIFGGPTNPPKNQSPKTSKDAMQGDPSTAEASRMNCLNTAQKSGLKATTYSRRKKNPNLVDGEVKCKNRKNEGVKWVKEVIREVPEAPNSKLPSKNLKENCTSNRDDKSGHDEAQKRSTLNSKHVEKKNAKGNSKAKSSELKAETPPAVKVTAPPGEEKGSLSERKIRVMQSLGLIAPAGSPFRREMVS
ncbi:Histone-lysine N-methyltransferase ATX1 [Carex littledalei]|uniref:Histone-lysine N-methyltransferase ATX1 n=1 Tax=Carex littledalei TaxID=544730 RepID=A0A833RU85_9POAL|nr:Histone-lysine N-methyltransferase ATX1 [Carex littledalei]